MNAVLSVQGASAPVKKKSFFSKFTRLNMLRLARAVIPAAVLMMFFPQLAMAAGSSGQDLMASGNTTVKATFGNGCRRFYGAGGYRFADVRRKKRCEISRWCYSLPEYPAS